LKEFSEFSKQKHNGVNCPKSTVPVKQYSDDIKNRGNEEQSKNYWRNWYKSLRNEGTLIWMNALSMARSQVPKRGRRSRSYKTGKRSYNHSHRRCTLSSGRRLSVCVSSASPSEVTLGEETIASRFTKKTQICCIRDKAYDSDLLDARLLAKYDLIMITPHKRNRVKPPTQDERVL
jgi:hypothetical protein